MAKNTLLRKAIEGNDKWMSVTPQLEAENLWFFVDEDVKVRTPLTRLADALKGEGEGVLRGEAGRAGRGDCGAGYQLVWGPCGCGLRVVRERRRCLELCALGVPIKHLGRHWAWIGDTARGLAVPRAGLHVCRSRR